MDFVRRLEDFFEKYIEGFFNARFSGGLQPVEIAKRLAREMESDRTVGISLIYVPNQYSVFLGKEDYERLTPYGQAIRDELAVFVAAEAKRKGYTIVGKPIVDIFCDEAGGRGQFRVVSHYSEPLPEEPEREATGPVQLSDTRVFGKLPPPVSRQASVAGLLTVVKGLDTGLQVDLGAERANIGRRESNELPLTDMNTSRLHAYVVFEDGGHSLYDAKSLNGTYVNDHRVTRKRLKAGDRIKVGNTVILYEVK
ncbi:FhaA domain-containing protein [Anaeroselena agilis]|uniref:DUF3662 and FHA domain-containing protein n=1 Tax=Anaeroselena agilis TaxID=3063788 RepID=A0ABU3NXG3_9FIRM|nr:DUF3662 and FHA domain-containing protein [Selenomonadales bacterium 4137-cl]